MFFSPCFGERAVHLYCMLLLQHLTDALLHFMFPHICVGCGSDILVKDSLLCLRCLDGLPQTKFELYPGNPVEKRFYGRLPLQHATAQFYFTKGSLVSHLVHEVKYKRNKDLGIQLGRIIGDSIFRAGRFDADLMIPLPLFEHRQRKRGYNQSMLLCEGMSELLKIPVAEHSIVRPMHTATQTDKGRMERWKNIEGKFELRDRELVAGKHILLVDDVITTGATLESCGIEILKASNASLSIACLCHAFR